MSDRLMTWLMASVVAVGSLTAADWSQWRQSDGNCIFPEALPKLADLSVVWEHELGVGYSGVTTADGRAYTLGHDGKATETLYCFDAATGKEVWRHSYPGKLLDNMHKGGPNATPLIDDGRVYSVSKDGQAFCLNAATGDVIWRVDLNPLSDAELPRWGYAASPQLVDGMLLVGGARVIALAPATGTHVWTAATPDKAAYSTPTVFRVKGSSYAATMSALGAHVIDLKDGRELGAFPMRANFDMIGTTPMVFADAPGEFFVTTSLVSARLRFDGRKLETVWVTTDMRNKFSNAVLIDGWLYGVDGRQGTRRAGVFCLNAATGKASWQQRGLGHGTIVAGTNGLLFLSDDGELVRLDANPKGYRERARKQVLSAICWTAPTLSNGRLYVRNDAGKLLCLGTN